MFWNEIMYEKNEIRTKIEHAVDVSGAFDNCFFHNYALYLISNNLPFPQDLFSFKSLLAQGSKAEKLHGFFPDPHALNLFSSLNQDIDNDHASTYLFEKTLVLGFLFREWFATQLAANSEHKATMLQGESGVINAFKNYREYRAFMSKEELYSAEFGLLYESNVSFLEYIFNRSSNGDGSSPFEKYFSDSKSDEEAITEYWVEEGFQLYCSQIAQSHTKLSYLEIMPMMKAINQSLTLFSTDNGSIVAEYTGTNEAAPKFEIAINVQQGHYYIFKNKDTQHDLEEYERTYLQYKKDRMFVLSDPERPVTSILVRVICPKGSLDEEPFDVLVSILSAASKQINTSAVTAKEATAPNYSFLIKVSASMVSTTAAVSALIGIAMFTNQYDPGTSLVEEAIVTVGLSGITGISYGLYNFFQSKSAATQKDSEIELDSSSDLPHKQKLS